MTFFFIFFYVIGAFIFFCHATIIIIQSSKKISSQMHFAENEHEQLFVNYFAKILFQTIMMMVFPISFWFYITINKHFSDALLISSGLFTVIWLVITGILIECAYYFMTHNIKTLAVFHYDKYFQNKEFFWVMCPMLFGILLSLYDYKIFPIILAIVLGKYIWMDSLQFISISGIKAKIRAFYTNFKSDIILIICQTFVMGYLLIRWYPMKNDVLNPEYTMTTFLLLALFLMPIIDLLIYKSMKSYSILIKNKTVENKHDTY